MNNKCHKTRGYSFLCHGTDCKYNPDRPGECANHENGRCYCFLAIADTYTNPDAWAVVKAHYERRGNVA